MKVTQEKLPASQIGLEIEISAETSKNTYEKVLQNLARSSNIPGFRKGKVPRQILVQQLGSQRIKAAALEELVQKSLQEAIDQESIESLGNFQLLSNFDELVSRYKPGEPLTFSASVDVPPEVQLGEYQNLSIKAEEITSDPKQVEDWLEERRKEQATLVPVENRPAQKGDLATIDYQGRFVAAEGEEGELIPNAQANDFQVELVEGKLIEGMIEGIFGMNLEETKEIAVTVPEDYPKEDLAGQPALFTITLKELKERELPQLDDDFAEEVSEFKTIAELKESLEKQFQEKAEKATKENIHQAIIAKLLEICSIDLPETMIQKEVDTLLTQTAIQMSNLGIDLKRLFTAEMVGQMRQRSRPEAITNIKTESILEEIAKRESISLESEEIEAKIKEVRQQLSGQDYDEQRLQDFVKKDLLKEKTLDWLQAKTQVELVPEGSLAKKEESEGEIDVDDESDLEEAES
jgi:trigger factor